MMGLLVACEGRPTGMTLGQYLRVSPPSLDMFFQSERLSLLYIYFIWTAPLFALAFEGALLPLSMHEPALSPLLALPKRIEPRTECLRDPPTLYKRAVQSYYIFMVSASQRANLTIYIFGEGLALRRGDRLSAVVFSVLYEHPIQRWQWSVRYRSSQRIHRGPSPRSHWHSRGQRCHRACTSPHRRHRQHCPNG